MSAPREHDTAGCPGKPFSGERLTWSRKLREDRKPLDFTVLVRKIHRGSNPTVRREPYQEPCPPDPPPLSLKQRRGRGREKGDNSHYRFLVVEMRVIKIHFGTRESGLCGGGTPPCWARLGANVNRQPRRFKAARPDHSRGPRGARPASPRIPLHRGRAAPAAGRAERALQGDSIVAALTAYPGPHACT